ncbi:hypothetical protein Tco_0367085 [Tanacetum coccineum]
MNLTHLCFADDLMMFVEGDKWSIEGALAVFDDFAIHSGLRISLEKSTIYMAGITNDVKEDILTDFPFEYGTLPVRERGFIVLGVSDQTTLREVMERDMTRIHRNALLNQVEHEILMLKEQRVHGQDDEFMWRLKDDTYSDRTEGDTGTLILRLSILKANVGSVGGEPDGFPIYLPYTPYGLRGIEYDMEKTDPQYNFGEND